MKIQHKMVELTKGSIRLTDGDGGGDACCCGQFSEGNSGNTGNTDCSFDGKRNLSDISTLIDHIYASKAETAVCE